MKKGNANSLIVFLSLIIIVVFGCFYFLYQYMIATGQHISDLSGISQGNMQSQVSLLNLESSLSEKAPQIQKVDSYFISADGDVAFIDSVESLAKANSLAVQINSVNIQSSTDLSKNNLEYLTLKITTSGSWKNTYAFLSLLSNLPYAIDVNQIDLNLSSSGSGGASTWQSTFNVKVLEKTGAGTQN